MGIGQKAKSFDQIDFDREDFGMNDDLDELPEENDGEGNFDNELEEKEKEFIEKQMAESSKAKKSASNDLFDQGGDDDEDNKEDPSAGKSTFEIRQMKVN